MKDFFLDDEQQRREDSFFADSHRTLGQAEEIQKPGDDPNLFLDLAAAPFRGAVEAGRSAYGLVDYLTFDALPDWDTNPLGKSQTTAGSVVEGVSEFLVGFIPVFGWLGKAGKVQKAIGAAQTVSKAAGRARKAEKLTEVARGAVAGAVTDFTFFDGQEARLSNLIEEHTELGNPLTEFLAADEDDSEIEGRLKNAIEGLGLGVATDTLILGFKGLRKARRLKEEGADVEDVNRALVEPFDSQEVIESSLDVPKREVTPLEVPSEKATPVVKSVARLPIESGRINTNNIEGAGRNLTETIDSPDDTVNLLQERAAHLRETLGEPGTETFEQTREKALERVADMTGQSFDAIKSNLRSSLGSVEEGIYQAQAAAELMTALADEVVVLSKKATETGANEDVLQALSAQEKLADLITINGGFGTAQGRGLSARRYLKQAEIRSVGIAKQLIDDLGGTKYLSTEFDKVAMAADSSGVAKLVRNNLTRGNRWFRAHNEYWINAILSGPKTTAINTIGNFAASVYLPFEGMVGAAVGRDGHAARAFAKQYSYILDSVQESFKFAVQAFKQNDNILNRGARTFDTPAAGREREFINSRLFKNQDSSLAHLADFIGKYVRMPTRFLMSTDEFFQQINYRSAAKSKLYQQGLDKGLRGDDLGKYVTESFDKLITQSGELYSEASITRQAIREAETRGLEAGEKIKFIRNYVQERWNPENSVLKDFADASGFAKGVAEEATFTRELEQGTIGHSLQQFVRRHPLAQIVMPFVRTPTNLIKFVGQRTFAFTHIGDKQLPILSSIHKKHVADITSGDPLRVSQAHGRFVMGISLFATASMAFHKGNITGGGPQDENERKLLMETGWRPYSFKIGDEYVSFQRLDPFATFFGLIADWNEVNQRSEDHLTEPMSSAMVSAGVALARNITNKSYLTGISQVIEAVSEPERFLSRFTKKQLASYVPNLVAQSRVAVGQDESLREVRTYFDAILNRLPGASNSLEPRRNIIGQPVDSAIASTPLLGKSADWVSPFVTSRDKNDPVFRELATLQHGFSQPSAALFGSINMLDFRSGSGQSSYDRWLQLTGEVKVGNKTLYDQLRKLIRSHKYNRLPVEFDSEGGDSPRIREIRRVISVYRRKALKQTMKEFPELKDASTRFKKTQAARRSGRTSDQIQQLIEQTN